MSRHEKGIRVGAICSADENKVKFFGWGIYVGDEIPPKGTIGPFGMDASEMGAENPKIVLDDGNVVWGCQCWWGPQEKVEKMIAGRPIEIVPVPSGETEEEVGPPLMISPSSRWRDAMKAIEERHGGVVQLTANLHDTWYEQNKDKANLDVVAALMMEAVCGCTVIGLSPDDAALMIYTIYQSVSAAEQMKMEPSPGAN